MTEQELNKACEFLNERLYPTVKVLNEDLVDVIDRWELIDEFRKAMGAVIKEDLNTVWHKVSEELPKENSTVLGVGISGYHYVCRYMYGHWFSENNLTERIIITHWMPIPKIKED